MKGFTLIELLVVVLIIGILAAAALPQYRVAVAKSRYAAGMAVVDAVYRAQQVYYMANGKYAPQFEDLDVSLPAGLRHVAVPGENGDDIWQDDRFRFVIRVDRGAGSYVYMVVQDADVHIKPEYLRRFNAPRARCYAHVSAEVWNKVCLSLGGKLAIADGFWNIYDL